MNKGKIVFRLYTDAASFNNGKKKFPKLDQITCSVGLLTLNDWVIQGYNSVNRNSTNNFGEIYAIYLTLKKSYKFLKSLETIEPPYNIELYSDSGICIQGLRDWMKSWKRNAVNGIWYNTSGEVANQDIFKKIDDEFIQNDELNIKFKHIKGHVAWGNRKDMAKMFKAWKQINGKLPDMDELRSHVCFNNICDEYAGVILDKVPKV